MTVLLADGYIPYSVRYGTRLRYTAIIVNTTIQSGNLGYQAGVPIRDDWEDYVNSKVSTVSRIGDVRVVSDRNCIHAVATDISWKLYYSSHYHYKHVLM